MTKARTLLHDVTLVDAAARSLTPHRSLVIEDGRISDEIPAVSADMSVFTEVVDGSGQYALPGFIDAHIHLRTSPHEGPSDLRPTPRLAPEDATSVDLDSYEQRAQTFLFCGVTSVYDAGNNSEAIRSVRAAERAGTILAPRIFCTGNLFSPPGGHGSTAGIHITESTDIKAAVAAHAALGPDLVKVTYDEHNWGVRPLVPFLSPQTLTRLIAEIHEHGLKVTVHVSNELRAREAVAAGADILAHPVIQSPMTPDFAELLATKRIPVVSTLAIGDRYFRLADDPDFVDLPLYRACESEAERERLRTTESEFQKGNRWADWMRVMTPIAQANIRMLVEAGGVLATGTDQSFGPDYLRELDLLSAAGLETWDILRAASTGAAAAIDQTGSVGTLAPGSLADIVLTDDNPVEDLTALSRLADVMKNGKIVDRSTLRLPANESVGRK
jgi:imidazolonepropionase-like amidohydrolase